MNVINIKDESQILHSARAFVKLMSQHKVFSFYGKMGAGKTTFIKAICEVLEVKDTVSSPTFAIINEYNSNLAGPIYHFDFYRIKDKTELYDFGYEDYVYSGNICFIEWPEKAEDLLPAETVKIEIIVNTDESRTIKIIT
jgi:tRNA threonylcarbamoyladenosine biosynthesis protein TsaE